MAFACLAGPLPARLISGSRFQPMRWPLRGLPAPVSSLQTCAHRAISLTTPASHTSTVGQCPIPAGICGQKQIWARACSIPLTRARYSSYASTFPLSSSPSGVAVVVSLLRHLKLISPSTGIVTCTAFRANVPRGCRPYVVLDAAGG